MGKIKAKAELLSDRLDIPAEASSGASKLTLTGKRRLLIENHKGILSYGDRLISVDCGDTAARICGDGLVLTAMDRNDMLISGRILSIELE